MKLKADSREIVGRKVKTLRAEGKVPANVYGPEHDSDNVILNNKEFRRVFKDSGYSKLIDLELNGDKLKTLVKEVQIDPVRREVLHVSLYAVDMKKEIEAEVPVEIVGVAPAVKNNIGFLEIPHNSLQVRCLPGDLPQQIEVDVSKLAAVGDAITIGDLDLGKGVELAEDLSDESRIASISAPQKIVIEEEETEGEEGAEGEESEEGAEGESEKAAGEEKE